MEDILYKKVLSINKIPKFIYIIETAPIKFNMNALVNSFIELFVFCHPYQIQKYYPEPINRMEHGILCFLTPPTPNIPFFHHSMDRFLELNSYLASVDESEDCCNLHQVYNEDKQNWLWNENIIEVVD